MKTKNKIKNKIKIIKKVKQLIHMCQIERKSETRMTASILKQDPNT